MQISLIAPTNLIEEYGNQGDFHLTLAHLLDDEENEYERKIKESELPIYLDNGLFENGTSVPLDELMEKATRLSAKYVFAPDVLLNREGTEANIDEAHKALEKANKKAGTHVKLAAVVQADNEVDYIESFLKMNNDERVSLIGLSILSVPKSFEEVIGVHNISESRLLLLDRLNFYNKAKGPIKDCHLLGAGSSYVEVSYASRNCPFVISHDSSSAIWNGVQGHEIKEDLTVNKGKTKVHVDFNFSEELSEEQKTLIQSNIDRVMSLSTN